MICCVCTVPSPSTCCPHLEGLHNARQENSDRADALMESQRIIAKSEPCYGCDSGGMGCAR